MRNEKGGFLVIFTKEVSFMKIDNYDDMLIPYPKIVIAGNTHIYNGHPFISSKVSVLRDKSTPSMTFRDIVGEITQLMTFEALSSLTLEDMEIMTPICKTIGKKIAGKKMVMLPIIRAGLAMEPAMREIVPLARTGHCGVYRDEETLAPVPYYWKVPKDVENRSVFILDPMLATGGSVNYAINRLKKLGCKEIIVMAIIGAPQGVDLIQTHHPDVKMYIAHLDAGLNRHGYIVPGLGDAGDRIFGTK